MEWKLFDQGTLINVLSTKWKKFTKETIRISCPRSGKILISKHYQI